MKGRDCASRETDGTIHTTQELKKMQKYLKEMCGSVYAHLWKHWCHGGDRRRAAIYVYTPWNMYVRDPSFQVQVTIQVLRKALNFSRRQCNCNLSTWLVINQISKQYWCHGLYRSCVFLPVWPAAAWLERPTQCVWSLLTGFIVYTVSNALNMIVLICIRTCICVRACACLDACMCACVRTFVHGCINACLRACIWICTSKWIYISVCICTVKCRYGAVHYILVTHSRRPVARPHYGVLMLGVIIFMLFTALYRHSAA